MLACLMKMLLACWRPVGHIEQTDVATIDRHDALLWYTDLSEHAAGDFSISVVQANSLLEDHSQVEVFSFGTFVGVYDGHGGPEAAKFVNTRLFQHVQNYASEQGAMSSDVLQRAFAMTEAEFLARVEESWLTRPQMAAVGSCCLVGVISQEKLYVANLGDSRAVLGTIREDGQLVAEQLTDEHNASYPEVRQELKAMHPDDPHIVVYKNGVWRVKGIIQVSRSVGDVYLKKAEYNREPLYAQFRLPQCLRRPVLLAEPTIRERTLRQEDKFVIFASDGLWEHLSNEDVVHIVHSHPRAGIARRLLKAALHVAARKREMRYADIRKIDRGVRRHFHDDITVVVLFIDYEKICTGGNLSPRSVRGGHISSNGEL